LDLPRVGFTYAYAAGMWETAMSLQDTLAWAE
jgi:hypothetical protein